MMSREKTTVLSTKHLTLIALMTAVTCILGPLTIPLPFSPVPISFTNLAIYLSVFVLGMKKSTISYVVYLLLGMAGLPVFSGFSGGLGKLAGPTGGYLLGFIFLALIAGYCMEKSGGKLPVTIAGMAAGTIVCYLFGTLWLCRQASLGFTAGLAAGVIPYIPGDIAKIILASVIGPALRKGVMRLQ